MISSCKPRRLVQFFAHVFPVVAVAGVLLGGCSSDDGELEQDAPSERVELGVDDFATSCQHPARSPLIDGTMSIEAGVLHATVTNLTTDTGSLVLEVHSQSRSGPRVKEPVTANLAPRSSTDFALRLDELGIATADETAQLAVVAKATLDDGRADVWHDEGLFVTFSGESWQRADSPEIDTTASTVDEPLPHLPNGVDDVGPPQVPAALWDMSFCFKQRSVFIDGGIGEDYWSETVPTYRPSYFQYMQVSNASGVVFAGYLNAQGCTGTVSVPTGTYTGYALSAAQSNSRYAFVYDNNAGAGSFATWSFSIGTVSSSATKHTNFAPTGARFNILAAAAYSLLRAAGDTATTYHFYADAPASANGNGNIYIETGRDDEKFLIGHEQGHRFFFVNASVIAWNNLGGYEISDTDADCASTGDGHNIHTKEHTGASFSEALASFYPALVYNNTAVGSDGWFGHFGGFGAVNIENGQAPPGLALAHMETACPRGVGMVGKGTEIDWLRQLWDVRTNSATSLNDMLNWLDNQGATMSQSNVYSKLEVASNNVGGNINASWDAEKFINGIDH